MFSPLTFYRIPYSSNTRFCFLQLTSYFVIIVKYFMNQSNFIKSLAEIKIHHRVGLVDVMRLNVT